MPYVSGRQQTKGRGLKLPERAGRKKQSQFGSPASAVGANTPTVQPSPTAPTPNVPPASTTVTKVGENMLSRETARLIGFSDEFEKLAAPRWKKMLRAGKLDEVHKNILRRLRVSDPAMESLRGSGMVRERAAHAADPKVFRKAFQQSTGQVPSTALNYSKEIAGLERGSEAIAKKKGIRIIEGSFPKAMRQADRAREALRKGDLRGVTSHGKAALTEGIGSLSTVGGGGLAIPFGKKPTILLNPLTNAIAVSAGAIPGTRARKGILAVTKRHEVNEQLAGAAQKATGGRTSGWYITRPPSGDLEEAMSKDLAEKAKIGRAHV